MYQQLHLVTTQPREQVDGKNYLWVMQQPYDRGADYLFSKKCHSRHGQLVDSVRESSTCQR